MQALHGRQTGARCGLILGAQAWQLDDHRYSLRLLLGQIRWSQSLVLAGVSQVLT